MYYNVWVLFCTSAVFTTAFYCGKREFFDQPEIVLTATEQGTKYTREDVNKATQAILKYFGETYDVNISITKIVSITNSPGNMNLRLFLYNPVNFTILGYTIDVEMPLSKKKISTVKFVKEFSEKSAFDEHKPFMNNEYGTAKFITE